jgi:hypothetical protein
VPARIAADTYKPAGRQNTASQVVPELHLHEGWDWTVPLPLPGEKSLQLFGNDTVENALFRMTRSVTARRTEHTPAGKQKLVRSVAELPQGVIGYTAGNSEVSEINSVVFLVTFATFRQE